VFLKSAQPLARIILGEPLCKEILKSALLTELGFKNPSVLKRGKIRVP